MRSLHAFKNESVQVYAGNRNITLGIHLCPCLFSLTQCTILDVFGDVFIHGCPVILMLDKVIGPVDSLVS